MLLLLQSFLVAVVIPWKEAIQAFWYCCVLAVALFSLLAAVAAAELLGGCCDS